MVRLYNAVLAPLRLAAELWGLGQRLIGDRGDEWRERLAHRLPSAPPGGVWIHGASLGEARVGGALAARLRERRPRLALACSAATATGRTQLPRPPSIDAAFYAPLDFAGLPVRLFRALRPALLVLVETELWPNLILEAEAADVRTVVVNGRLSTRRMARYRRFAALYGPLLRRITRVGAQTPEDARRFVELGLPCDAVEITGSVKYDLPTPEVDPDELRRRFAVPLGRPVFVAGSTRAGEEAPVLEAFARARSRCPELLLILAPRHPERFDETAAAIRSRGLQMRRATDVGEAPSGAIDVLLLDSVGWLARLYTLATVAFVGGTLVPVGGHNVLEPVAAGTPVLFGRHTEHFAEPAAVLEDAGAGRRVADAAELGDAVAELVLDRERRRAMAARGAHVLSANRGALERTVDLVLAALDRDAARPAAEAR